MILLLHNQGDAPALKFMELCDREGMEYFQIVDGQEVVLDDIQIENGALSNFTVTNQTTGKQLAQEMITGFFYRKGNLEPHFHLNFHPEVNPAVGEAFARCLTDEWEALVFYIFDWIKQHVPSIGQYNDNIPNKLKMLHIASQCGFRVPDSYIVSHSKAAQGLARKMPCVTKSIQDVLAFEHDHEIYRSYTSPVNPWQEETSSIFPSLIQQRIQSHYEIRLFYFDRYFYAAAIAHDKVNNPSVDYRNAQGFPDIFPYHLTRRDIRRLLKFVKHCGYNSGSIDFLLSDQGELFFLEINPVGQFDFVSDFCGRNIETDIVKFFKYHHRNPKQYE